jgi:tetratricopeptide (TPR) repeat protein
VPVSHYRDGDKKVGKGDLDGAIEEYSRAIAISSRLNSSDSETDETSNITVIDPFTANAYTNRGVARYRKGDFEGAKADFDAALRIRPGLAYAYLNRAATRRELGDLQGALVDLDKAISIQPKLFEAYNNRGSIRHDLGNLQGALADFNLAIKLNVSFF